VGQATLFTVINALKNLFRLWRSIWKTAEGPKPTSCLGAAKLVYINFKRDERGDTKK
jgi:hypothetical protein